MAPTTFRGLLPVAAVALLLLATLASAHDDHTEDAAPLKTVSLPKGWKPEGIAAGYRKHEIYSGSIKGRIALFNTLTGAVNELVNLEIPAISTRILQGLKLSRDLNLLFVAGGLTGQAYVLALDPKTGLLDSSLPADQQVQRITLAALPIGASDTYINDVSLHVISGRGRGRRGGQATVIAYFTDSFRPYLYQVTATRARGASAPTVALTATYTADAFARPAGTGFASNGIIADPFPAGTVISSNSVTGKILVVTLPASVAAPGTPTPVTATPIAVTDTTANAPVDKIATDGLLPVSPCSTSAIISVENSQNRAYSLTFTSADFTTATTTGFFTDPLFKSPSTAARTGAGYLYVANTYFAFGCPGAQLCPEQGFELVRVDAPEVALQGKGHHRGGKGKHGK